ncbi:MAG: cupin [Planctomycetota bacterium]
MILPCSDLAQALAFFQELGFQVETIFPADAPRVAVLSAAGLRMRLEPGDGDPGTIRITSDRADSLVAPNGTRVELVPARSALEIPEPAPELVVVRNEGSFKRGRAGMQYRDLIPGRQGGRFIASHIRIEEGGPVPDWVHFHEVRFQMIYCYRGWVKVVYEDQGPPFVMQAGDCVLQPPRIRHRVLECSPGLEVIEISCPAEHPTHADPELELPTGAHRPERDFSGQRFLFHEAASATWSTDNIASRDLGLAAATGALAGGSVRRANEATALEVSPKGELWFGFVLEGGVDFRGESLPAGSALTLPPGEGFELHLIPGTELLEITLPGR